MYHLKQIPSEAQIRKYFRRTVFGKNIHCPVCGSQKVLQYEQRYRCLHCREKFSLLSHTWLTGMRLSYQKFWLTLWCWTNQVPVKQAIALTELSEKALRHWYGLFRDHLPDNAVILEKIIQLDEAYFKGMTLIMGKEQGSKKLAYIIVPGTTVYRGMRRVSLSSM